MMEKRSRNGFAEADQILHHVQWQHRHDITTLFKLKDPNAPDTPPAPVVYPAQSHDKIWGFKELDITEENGTLITTLPPPTGDILTICKNHVTTLEKLIQECEAELK